MQFFSGLGGLGQMGVLIGKAMGNKVVVISRSDKKEDLARKLGADDFLISTNPESMASGARSIDLILDTVSGDHEIEPYLELLKKKGVLVILGVAYSPMKVTMFWGK